MYAALFSLFDAFLASLDDIPCNQPKPLTNITSSSLHSSAHFHVFNSLLSRPLRCSSGKRRVRVDLWSARQRLLLQLHPSPATHQKTLSSASNKSTRRTRLCLITNSCASTRLTHGPHPQATLASERACPKLHLQENVRLPKRRLITPVSLGTDPLVGLLMFDITSLISILRHSSFLGWSSASVRFFTRSFVPSVGSSLQPAKTSSSLRSFTCLDGFHQRTCLPSGCSKPQLFPALSCGSCFPNSVQRAQHLPRTCCNAVAISLDDMTVIVLGRRRHHFHDCRTVSEPLAFHQSIPCCQLRLDNAASVRSQPLPMYLESTSCTSVLHELMRLVHQTQLFETTFLALQRIQELTSLRAVHDFVWRQGCFPPLTLSALVFSLFGPKCLFTVFATLSKRGRCVIS